MTTPEVGAVSVVWLMASWAAATCAWADATWACADARAFGLTWVWIARLSRDEVICWEAALIRVWPLMASVCCLVLSFASCDWSWLHDTPGQSALTLVWSLATVAASAWFWALTEATVSL